MPLTSTPKVKDACADDLMLRRVAARAANSGGQGGRADPLA
jgi:hypothetical protein